MTLTSKIIFALVAITIVASVPIMNNVTVKLNSVPSRTPINVPTALKNATQADKSIASERTYPLYFVALEDNGVKGKKIGCNDSLVAVEHTATSSATPTAQQRLTTLFEQKSQNYKDTQLYNALYQSDIKVSEIKTLPDGSQQIFLTGTPKLGGVCDTPRVIEQITATAKGGNENNRVAIYLNNKALGDALSQK